MKKKYGHLLEQHTVQCGRHIPSEHGAPIFGTENNDVTGLSDTWAPTYQTAWRQFQYYVVLKHTATKTLNFTREMFHTHTHTHTHICTYIHINTHTYIQTYICHGIQSDIPNITCAYQFLESLKNSEVRVALYK